MLVHGGELLKDFDPFQGRRGRLGDAPGEGAGQEQPNRFVVFVRARASQLVSFEVGMFGGLGEVRHRLLLLMELIFCHYYERGRR